MAGIQQQASERPVGLGGEISTEQVYPVADDVVITPRSRRPHPERASSPSERKRSKVRRRHLPQRMLEGRTSGDDADPSRSLRTQIKLAVDSVNEEPFVEWPDLV